MFRKLLTAALLFAVHVLFPVPAKACHYGFSFGYSYAFLPPVQIVYAPPVVTYALPAPVYAAPAPCPAVELPPTAPPVYAAPAISYGAGYGASFGYGVGGYATSAFFRTAFVHRSFFISNRTFFRGAFVGRRNVVAVNVRAAPVRGRAVFRQRTVIRGR